MAVKVSIVIPAYNEAAFISDTIKAVKSYSSVGEIIVIDDGSTDGTEYVALKAGASVYRNSVNLGKGESLNIGSALTKGKIIVFLDADLGLAAWEAVKLWEIVELNEADCAIARFPKAKKAGGLGLVKALAKWGVHQYGGKNLSAVLSGQRAFSRRALEAIFPLEKGFGAETKASIDLLKKGFRIKEVEVSMTHRETGRNLAGFLHRGKQFKHILKVLANEALR